MADENGNGRVTLAVLGTKMDQVIKSLEEMKAQRQEDHDCVIVLAEKIKQYDERILPKLRADVDKIDTREKWWSGLNSLATAIAIGLWASMRQP